MFHHVYAAKCPIAPDTSIRALALTNGPAQQKADRALRTTWSGLWR
jgi:hypothetical protein